MKCMNGVTILTCLEISTSIYISTKNAEGCLVVLASHPPLRSAMRVGRAFLPGRCLQLHHLQAR